MYKNFNKDDIIDYIPISADLDKVSQKEEINNNLIKMNTNLKRYLISSAVTFLSGFALVLLSQWDSITLASFGDGSIMGVLFVALRAGVKALIEYLISLK